MAFKNCMLRFALTNDSGEVIWSKNCDTCVGPSENLKKILVHLYWRIIPYAISCVAPGAEQKKGGIRAIENRRQESLKV